MDGNSYATDTTDYASFTIRFESGDSAMEAPLLQINQLTHSEQGLDMLLGPTPITVSLSSPKMSARQTERLPAGLFLDGATAMLSAWDRLKKLRDDQVSNCTIPAMLVIT